MKNKVFKKGIMLVEVLVATFIFSIILTVLITVNNLYLTSASSNLKSVKATYLAEEGMEALKIIRDTSWTDFQNIPSGTRYLYFSNTASSTWQATTSISYKTIDSINRWFVLYPVNRDSGNEIVETGGVLDPNTKKVVVSVSWEDRGKVVTKSMSTYLTNIIVN